MGDYSTIEIRGDNEDLKDSLTAAEGLFKSFGNKVMSLFQQATGIYSFDDALAKIRKGIADFEESQEHIRGLERALKSSGEAAGFTVKQLDAMNSQLQKISKYTANTLTDAQAVLSKFKNVRLDIFQDALKSATDLAEYMGGDLTGAVKVLGAALNSPRKGLEDLEDAGVEFTKKQKAQIEGFLRMGNVVAAQRVILKAVADQMGGEGAKAADTFGVRMQRLGEATDKTWKTIGGMLVPWINKAIDVVNKINVVVDALVKEWVSGWVNIGETTVDVVKILTEWFWKAVDVGTQAFTMIQSAIQDWEGTAKGVFLSVKAIALNAFADILESAISWGDKAIALWPEVQKAAADMWKKIVELSGWAIGEANKYWDEFVSYTKSIFDGIWRNIETFWAKLKMLMTGQNPGDWAWKDFTKKFKHAGEEMPSLIDDVKKRGIGKATGADDFIGGLRDKAKDAADGAGKALDPFWDRFDDNLKANKKKVQDFTDKVKGILDADEYKKIKGTDSGKKFKGLDGDDEGKQGGGNVGQFEDFIAMNRRIQSAAAKPPDLRELEKQSKLMERELAVQEAIRDAIRDQRKAAHTKTPPVPNQAGQFGMWAS